MTIIDTIEKNQLRTDVPDFEPGDTVRVHVRIKEGDRVMAIGPSPLVRHVCLAAGYMVRPDRAPERGCEAGERVGTDVEHVLVDEKSASEGAKSQFGLASLRGCKTGCNCSRRNRA